MKPYNKTNLYKVWIYNGITKYLKTITIQTYTILIILIIESISKIIKFLNLNFPIKINWWAIKNIIMMIFLYK